MSLWHKDKRLMLDIHRMVDDHYGYDGISTQCRTWPVYVRGANSNDTAIPAIVFVPNTELVLLRLQK